LEEFALFRTLSADQRLRVLNAMVRQDLVRGQKLVVQGGPSDAVFLVLHGALAVRKTGYSEPIAELRAGELVGEIGFFANGPRTADVIAIRDTSVLALTRPAYQKLVAEAPAIVEALLAALARRFAKETARIAPFPASPKARTVALIDGGSEPLPAAFDRRMREGLAAIEAEIVDPRTLRPLDEDLIFASVRKTNRCIVVEEGWRYAGFGAEVADRVQRECFDDLDAPVTRITAADVPMPYAKTLEKAYLPQPERVAEAARQALYR